MRAALAIVLAVAGCDKVLGLTPIATAPDGGPTFAVTGRLRQRYPANDEQGKPYVATYIPAAPGFAVTLDDGTTPSVDYHADGTFSFPIDHPGQAYRIAVSGGDLDGDYELAAPTLDLVKATGSRPAELREPVVHPTPVHFELTGTVKGTTWIGSSGIGSLTATVDTRSDFSFDWLGAQAFTGSPGLLDASDYHDRVYVLDVAKVSTYYSIQQSFTAATDLADGITATVPGSLATAPQTGCLHLVTHTAEIAQQIQTIYGTSGGATYWAVSAVPSTELPWIGAYTLAFLQATNPMADEDTDIVFSPGPFTDYATVAQIFPVEGRSLQLPGDTVPLTAYLGGQVAMTVPSATDCKLAQVQLTSPTVAMANEPLVEGIAIAADATPVPAPTAPFEVRWGYTVSGFADYSEVRLYELRSVGGTTTPHLVDRTTVVANSVTFPASDLVSGHRYSVWIRTNSGLPSAIAGDFATASYPVANFDLWSHWFQVQ